MSVHVFLERLLGVARDCQDAVVYLNSHTFTLKRTKRYWYIYIRERGNSSRGRYVRVQSETEGRRVVATLQLLKRVAHDLAYLQAVGVTQLQLCKTVTQRNLCKEVIHGSYKSDSYKNRVQRERVRE